MDNLLDSDNREKDDSLNRLSYAYWRLVESPLSRLLEQEKLSKGAQPSHADPQS